MMFTLQLAWQLALTDIKIYYRRSTLGPLWMTLTLFAQVVVIGFIFSGLFIEEIYEYMLFLASGLILWNFLVVTINEATISLINAGPLIKQVSIPLVVNVYRVIFKNMIILGHNLFILVPIYLVADTNFGIRTLLLLPGILILLMNLTWVAVVASILSARFRDVPSIVSSFLTLGFFITPILWRPEQIVGSPVETILKLNPMYHIIQVARLPIIGEVAPVYSTLISIVCLIIGIPLAILIFKKKARSVPFWV